MSRGNLEAFNTLIAEARAGGHANEQAMALVYDFVCFDRGSSGSKDHQTVLRHFSSIH